LKEKIKNLRNSKLETLVNRMKIIKFDSKVKEKPKSLFEETNEFIRFFIHFSDKFEQYHGEIV
jgi:hypothetical protein